MKSVNFKSLTTFAAICAAMKKNEQDYAISADATNTVNEAIARGRLMLLSKAANGDKVVDLTNPDQWKYTPVHRIIRDASSSFGFRLSYYVCGCDCGCSVLGARPPFLEPADATYAGETFPEEFAQWLYYLNKMYQE